MLGSCGGRGRGRNGCKHRKTARTAMTLACAVGASPSKGSRLFNANFSCTGASARPASGKVCGGWKRCARKCEAQWSSGARPPARGSFVGRHDTHARTPARRPVNTPRPTHRPRTRTYTHAHGLLRCSLRAGWPSPRKRTIGRRMAEDGAAALCSSECVRECECECLCVWVGGWLSE